MATTTPDNLRTPNPGDPYNLVPDLATLANDVQNALNNKQSNVFKGTAAQRAAFLSTAVQGMLWQDTDGIKMIWRRDVSAWLPAVWRWAGTTSQMNGFTQAPNGFEWFNTSNNLQYVRFSGSWRAGVVTHRQDDTTNSLQPMITQGGIGMIAAAVSSTVSKAITFPVPFTSVPIFSATYIGARNTSTFNPIGLTDFSGTAFGKGISPSLTGGTVVAGRADGGNLVAGWFLYFSWTATGVVA